MLMLIIDASSQGTSSSNTTVHDLNKFKNNVLEKGKKLG